MFDWLKREFLELLPAIIYFFIAFSILIVNEQLILGDAVFVLSDFIRPLVGALLVAKILLVVNMLPIVDLFRGRPLIWNTAWKAALYWLCGLLFQGAESFIHFLIGGHGSAGQQMLAEISSTKFIAVQMWLLVLLLLFVGMQQMASALGAQRVRELFFGAD